MPFSHKYDQTDFGRIYYSSPKETLTPRNINELASTLKSLNTKKQRVKIKNTGHSVNGQTLTKDTQVNVSEINHIVFDKVNMEVTCGVGASWNAILHSLEFPSYCIPMFPNNPGQKIQIGGTAAVGGEGFYSSKVGGFWNQVIRAKVVTMEGEIIECDRNSGLHPKNLDILQYSLGGFGRIGVLAEITVKVEKSKKNLLGLVIPYNNYDKYERDLNKCLETTMFNGVVSCYDIPDPQKLEVTNFFHYIIELFLEIDDNETPRNLKRGILNNLDTLFALYAKQVQTQYHLDLSLMQCSLTKNDLVYYYPSIKENEPTDTLCHPWSDYIIPPKNYYTFIHEALKIISKHKMGPHILKETSLFGIIQPHLIVSYNIKSMPGAGIEKYPLCLDLPNQDYARAIGIMPSVTPDKLESALHMVNELTDLAFSLNGKRYLYGYHNLSLDQIEKQYTPEVIQKWQKLKNTLDPHNLLNIGVIEHLDA